ARGETTMRSRSTRTLRFVVRHLQSWPVSLALVAACLGSLAVGFTAHADPPLVTYYACVNLSTGSIKMTTATGTCRSHEQLISWNEVGSGGPAGPQGPAGPPGKGDLLDDMAYAELQNTDLLSFHDLTGYNLSNSDLTGARLYRSNLTSANLTGARLIFADLTGANLTNANLTNANLTDATLTQARLTGSNLTGANLTRVIWSDTTCPDGTNSDNDGGTCVGHGGGL